MEKFSVVIVNYKTWYLVEYQLRIYYEFNDAADFHIFIVDNSSCDEERVHLAAITAAYEVYGNIELVYNVPVLADENRHGINLGSSQHGQALDAGIAMAYRLYDLDHRFSFCIVQDPDWIWSVPGHIRMVRDLLRRADRGAVGGSYNFADMHIIAKCGDSGRWDFPALFGCAFKLPLFDRGISLAPGDESGTAGVLHGKDVGWRKRRYFTMRNIGHMSFLQSHRSRMLRTVGALNSEGVLFEYCVSVMARRIVCYHILRGAQPDPGFYDRFTAEFLSSRNPTSECWRDNKLSLALAIYADVKANHARYLPIGRALVSRVMKMPIGPFLYPVAISLIKLASRIKRGLARLFG